MAELAGVMVGNYFLLECLKREGIVETYRARPTLRGGCDVLMRIFRPSFPDPAGFQEHFMEEVEKVWRCRNTHIQPLLEYGAGDDLLYCVTELVEAETLEQYLERWEREHGQAALPAPLVARWTTQLCEALAYAHKQGIAHGNIQPSSILLHGDDTLLLTDFSMRRIVQESDAAIAQVEEGNASYIAPEQAIGLLSPASDIYAVGVLLFRLFTGQLPYDGDSPGDIALNHANEPIPSLRSFCPDMPEAVEMVVRVALAKTPQARFPTADALAHALLAALVKDEPPPPLITPTQTITPRRRVQGRAGQPPSIWSRAISLFSVLVVLAGLVGVLLFFAADPFHLQDLPFMPFRFPPGSGSLHPGTGPTPVVTSTVPPHAGSPGRSSGVTTRGSGTPTPGVSPTGEVTPMPSSSFTPTPPTPTSTTGPVLFACTMGTLSIDGSPYLAPVLAQVNQDFLDSCPGVNVTLRSDGTRALNMVQNGHIDLADTDVTARVSRDLVDHPVAALLYTLIVSPDVAQAGISDLSLSDIQAIYAGTIDNWSQLGGPDEHITVFYPPSSASINAIFRTFVLNGTSPQVSGNTLKKDNPSQMAQQVSKTPGALGYVPLEALSTANVQALAIDGVQASAQSLLNGSYPFWSVEHVYTQGFGSAQAQSWIQFLLLSQEANTLLSYGVVPLAMLSTGVMLSHLPGPEF
jgi:ABC-type phosphate transport system substrate-binding protein